MEPEYMSSEDEVEEVEDQGGDEERQTKVFVSHQKPWASDTLIELFKHLDKYYKENIQSKKGMYQMLPRREGGITLNTSAPSDAPKWVLKRD